MIFYNRWGVVISQAEAKTTVLKLLLSSSDESVFVDQHGTDVQTIYSIEDDLQFDIESISVYANHGEGKPPTKSFRSCPAIYKQAKRLMNSIDDNNQNMSS